MVRPTCAACFPIWPCSRWGLPCRGCCHPRGALLPHHFTLTGAACAALRRYLSVALSVGSRPQALPGTVPYGARTFLHPLQLALTRTATAWPTLGGHHTQIWLRMRGGLLFEVQGALVASLSRAPVICAASRAACLRGNSASRILSARSSAPS